MKPKLYVETSVIGYLAARPSRDLVMAANQQVTHDWWHSRRNAYELWISRFVIEEISVGDPEAAARRLEIVREIDVLEVAERANDLGKMLIASIPLPSRAAIDAMHVAVAIVQGMDFLVSWNCKHIANAAIRSRIESICRAVGLVPPIICTPQELLEEIDT